MTTRFATANPAAVQNQATVELTIMQVNQASEIMQSTGVGIDNLPAIILALAINKQTLALQAAVKSS